MEEAISLVENRRFVLILNEPKLTEDFHLSEGITVFHGAHSKNLVVITNMGNWEPVWIPTEVDAVLIKTMRSAETYYVCGVYFNPALSMIDFKIKVAAVHDHLRRHRSNRLVLGGDVNAESYLWSNKENSRGKVLKNSLIHCKLFCPIPNDGNTSRVSWNGERNWIDAIFIDNILGRRVTDKGGIILKNSDHNLLFVDIMEGRTTKIVVSKSKLTNLCKNINLEFLNSEWSNCEIADRKCIILERLMTLIGNKSRVRVPMDRLEKIIPRNVVKFLRKLKSSISKSKRKMFMVSSKMHENELADKLEKMRKLNTGIKQLKRASKRKRINELLKDGKLWYLIRKSLGRDFFRGQIGKDLDSKPQSLISSEEEFIAKFKDEFPVIVNEVHIYRPAKLEFDMDQLVKAVTKKIGAKSCMFEGFISCKTLALMMEYRGAIIVKFALECLRHGYTPQFIKRSRISLIPKGCNSKVRPVAIMHPIYRLFDAILYFIVKKKVKFWWGKQFAFKNNSGPLDLFRSLKFSIEKLNNEFPVILISLDLSDAFENINFDAIYLALICAGISPMWSRIVIQHIRNRTSWIKVKDSRKWFVHLKGTPQGVILSPLLFCLTTLLLKHFDEADFELFLFADDIFILATGTNNTLPWLEVGRKLEQVEKVLNSLGLEINPRKSKAMFIKPGSCKGKLRIGDGNRISVNNKIITIGFEVSILGVNLFIRKGSLGGFSSSDIRPQNTMLESVSKLQRRLTPYASRLQTLRLDWLRTVLLASIYGICFYYGPIQRVFLEWNQFSTQCEEVISVIGEIFIMSLDIARTARKSLFGKIALKKPLNVMIEKCLVDQCLKIKGQLETMWTPTDIPIPPIWGLRIITEPKMDLFTQIKEKHGWTDERVDIDIVYKTAAIKTDLWIGITFYGVSKHPQHQWVENRAGVTRIFRYWKYQSSYLDELEDALWMTLVEVEREIQGKTLVLEATTPVAHRIMSPMKKSRLNIFLEENDTRIAIVFRKSERCRLTVPVSDMKQMPRLVIYPSAAYFKLLEMMYHMTQQKECSNLVESGLHRYGFLSINWKIMTRRDIYAISLLAGSWRCVVAKPECSRCGKIYTTQKLLTEACPHLPEFNWKGNKVTERMLPFTFCNLKYISRTGLFLYRVTKCEALNE